MYTPKYQTLSGFGNLGQVNQCSADPSGALCKNNVKKDDVDEIMHLVNDAKNCANRCVTGNCSTCAVRRPLQNALDKTGELISRLNIEGNTQAASRLQGAQLTLNELLSYYDTISWEAVVNYIDGSYHDGQGRPFSPGDGTILTNLSAARDSIYFINNLTPAEDARRASYIRGELAQLNTSLRDFQSKLSSPWSVTGALSPTSNANLIQDYVRVRKLIRDAWVSPATRSALLNEYNGLFEQQKAVAKQAGQEGEALNNAIESAVGSVSTGWDCLTSGTGWDKFKCLFSGDLYYAGYIGTAVGGLFLLWLIRPFIVLLSQSK